MPSVYEECPCKVFPVYCKITGVKLATRCPSIGYTIYEEFANWSRKGTPSGGTS